VPEEYNRKLHLKFSVDNAQMASHSSITEEAAGFDILHEGQALSSAKSPDNCHLWAMYMGQETVPELDTELAQGFQAIEKLHRK
jgi:hypothetical protein